MRRVNIGDDNELEQNRRGSSPFGINQPMFKSDIYASKPAGLLLQAAGRPLSEALLKLREAEFNHGRNG